MFEGLFRFAGMRCRRFTQIVFWVFFICAHLRNLRFQYLPVEDICGSKIFQLKMFRRTVFQLTP